MIGRLTSFLEFEDGLSSADQLYVKEQIDALSILEAEDEPESIPRRIKIAEKIRQMAPGAVKLGQPIIQTVVSAEVQQVLHIHG
jgi:hypothetical protein